MVFKSLLGLRVISKLKIEFGFELLGMAG